MIITQRNISVGKLEKVADVLKAIAHPIRLNILEVLESKESLTVTEIQETMPVSVEQSLLSHHLIKMKDKGVLKCERSGQFIRYAMADRKLLQVLDCMENCDFVTDNN